MREQTFQKYCNKVRQLEKRVKTLEQETSILNKIRTEINELDKKVCQQFLIEDVDKEVHHAYQDCLAIIDKCKAGSEV